MLRILFFFIITQFIFSDIFFEELKKSDSIYLKLKENTYLNNKTKSREYFIKILFPDKIYKEITSPNLNKGEIYLYNKDTKIVYLPKFKQKSEKKIDDEELYIKKFLNDLRLIDLKNIKNNKIENEDKEILFENSLEIKSIYYKNEKIKVEFYNYQNGIPKKIKIFDNNSIISEIDIIEYNFKVKFSEEDFVLK